MEKRHPGTNRSQSSAFQLEFSAGGIVREKDRLLMVKVENLEGKVVWTFPKGHIEKGETSKDAAVREVEEETGYKCEIVKPFEKVQYWFRRGSILVKKTVTWFLMKPVNKTGTHDTEEIIETEWVSLEETRKRATYKSDLKLLSKLK
jgi:mutator protein MutT